MIGNEIDFLLRQFWENLQNGSDELVPSHDALSQLVVVAEKLVRTNSVLIE